MATENIYAGAMLYNDTPGVGDWIFRIDLSGVHTNAATLTVKATVGDFTMNGNTASVAKDADETTATITVPITAAAGETVTLTVTSNNSNDTAVTYVVSNVCSVRQTGDSHAVVAHTDYGNAKLVRSATPANALAVDANNKVAVPENQKVDLNTVKTQAITCAAAVTVNPNVGTTQPVNFDGTGENAVVRAGLWGILGTALTETSGYLAAAFKKFFNIAEPANTLNDLAKESTAAAAKTAAEAALPAASYTAPPSAATIAATVAAVGLSLTSDERNSIADALLDRADAVDSKTVRQALRYMAAVVAGKVRGAGTGTEIFTGLDGTTDRVAVSATATGNRTSLTYDPST